jgi:signal transduction histidine kinase
MAVRLADYFSNHVTQIIRAAAAVQVATLFALGILLYNAGFSPLIILVYILLPVVLLQSFAFVLIIQFALTPLQALTKTITYVSKQASDVAPPNLNGTYHEKTGLKLMVDTVIGLASADASRPKADTEQEVSGDSVDATKVLEAAPAGIIALDASGAIVYANSTAPVATDTNGNKSINLVFLDEDNSLSSWLDENAESAVNATKIWPRIADAIAGESDSRKLYDVVATYRKAGEGGIETVIVTIDRTSTYLIDEEDTDFIALAAHELRGPITIIRGYIDVLGQDLKGVIQGDQQELLDRLDVSASRLSSYVSNILNVARYDRRHLKLHLVEDKFSNVYAAIADDLQLRARTQNRLLSVNIPETLPTIAADRNSLSEVLANLVDNAIKYSNEGGHVEVNAAVDGDFVRCNVIDNGIGIPASVVGSLFTKFYRSHRSRQDVSGTGLGLYISKGIIESHGGKIGVSSKEGEGSTFTFSVPIYSTVADKLLSGNDTVVKSAGGWIKNHAMFRG